MKQCIQCNDKRRNIKNISTLVIGNGMPPKKCKSPRERIGQLLKDGTTKKCLIPCDKLKRPARSTRVECKEYAKNKTTTKPPTKKETVKQSITLTKKTAPPVKMPIKAKRVGEEPPTQKIDIWNKSSYKLGDPIIDIRQIGRIYKQRNQDDLSLAFANFVKKSTKTRKERGVDKSMWEWYLDDFRKVTKEHSRPYGIIDYADVHIRRMDNPIKKLYDEFLKTDENPEKDFITYIDKFGRKQYVKR
jgi:hypothetical protein